MGSSCGGGRTVDVRPRLAGTLPWLLLRRRWRFSFVRDFARTPVARTLATVASVAAVAPVEAITPIAAVTPAVVTVAIALDSTHHGGGTLFVFLDPDREIAQHVFVEAF